MRKQMPKVGLPWLVLAVVLPLVAVTLFQVKPVEAG